MRGNYRHTRQQYQQQQEDYYYQQQGVPADGFYQGGAQEHMGTVYYQQPPPAHMQPYHQAPGPPGVNYPQQQQFPYYHGYQGDPGYYPGNPGFTPGAVDVGQDVQGQGQAPRGRGRGQRGRGGRGGRGYQSQGRHKRYNQGQNPGDTKSDASAKDCNEGTETQGAEGYAPQSAKNNTADLHFNEAKDHYAGDNEDKNFAQTVEPEKSTTRRGNSSRGGRSYSRGGGYRQRGGRNVSQMNDNTRAEAGSDVKAAQREARQKLLANQKRRQIPGSDDEDEGTPPETQMDNPEGNKGKSGRQTTQNVKFRGDLREKDRGKPPGRRGDGPGRRGEGPGRRKHGGDIDRQNSETQRGTLIEHLRNATYECMVCCDNIRCEAAVWSCSNCFNVFHLRCVKKWAKSPAAAVENRDGSVGGWRCPGCQHVAQRYPNVYRCFCGKVKDPLFSRHETPHSCAELCQKSRGNGCTHPCNILCHPGPCPPCLATVNRRCDCGKTRQTLKCSQATKVKCTEVCDKMLNCGRHSCRQVCHPSSCEPCDEIIHQVCFCEKQDRDVVCGSAESFTKQFTCDQTCDRQLECSNHKCQSPCHPGVCEKCTLLPSAVNHCPCGRSLLSELTNEERASCLDPVPTCEEVCGKELKCGPGDARHMCARTCHEGSCGACASQTTVTCRCGALSRDLPCQELTQYNDENPFTCDKRCNKKRTCGMHKCGKTCCVDADHLCDLICGKRLSCALHRCEEPCHRGNCPVCWHVSFDELRCHCGLEVLFPPVPCGTRPPECHQLCTRAHACDHVVRHACHSEDTCPPCTELTEKWCMGKHEKRRNIACHVTDISCGMPCKKELHCGGGHTCLKGCHKDACTNDEDTCSQPCTRQREECGHPCGNPCHGESTCPRTACQTKITIKCKCGNRTGNAMCMIGGENKDYNRMATMMMAMKMSDTIDISNLTGTGSDGTKKKTRLLECTEQCGVIERNRRLALALEIKNPDVSGKLGAPCYPEFLKDSARKFPSYVSKVEKALSDLVHSAQKSKQPKRSHVFPPANQVQRRVVHELAEFYGCETQSYDQEPNKNVVATAYKDKCWHPNVSLTQAVQRDMHGKVLSAPIPLGSKEKDIRSSQQALKQSTKMLGGNPWGRAPTSDQASSSTPAKPAWGPLQTGPPPSAPTTGSKPAPWAHVASSNGGARRGSGQDPAGAAMAASSTTNQRRKSIDYFDMTE